MPLGIYCLALCLTLLIEVPIATWFLRSSGWRRVAAASVAANLATHVTIHVVVPRLGLPLPAWDLVGEAFAFAVEAALYALVIRPRSAWWAVAGSALANGVSYTAGVVLFAG